MLTRELINPSAQAIAEYVEQNGLRTLSEIEEVNRAGFKLFTQLVEEPERDWTYSSSEWHVNAEAMCERCGKEHIVTGFTKEKRNVGGLKNDLVKILRDDYPDCKLQPKPVEAFKTDAYFYVTDTGRRAFQHREDPSWGVYTKENYAKINT